MAEDLTDSEFMELVTQLLRESGDYLKRAESKLDAVSREFDKGNITSAQANARSQFIESKLIETLEACLKPLFLRSKRVKVNFDAEPTLEGKLYALAKAMRKEVYEIGLVVNLPPHLCTRIDAIVQEVKKFRDKANYWYEGKVSHFPSRPGTRPGTPSSDRSGGKQPSQVTGGAVGGQAGSSRGLPPSGQGEGSPRRPTEPLPPSASTGARTSVGPSTIPSSSNQGGTASSSSSTHSSRSRAFEDMKQKLKASIQKRKGGERN